jgi:hypothetical protein
MMVATRHSKFYRACRNAASTLLSLLATICCLPLPAAAAASSDPAPPPQLQQQATGQQTAAELYDIKGPIVIADNTRILLIIGAVLLALVVLTALGVYLYKRLKKEKAIQAHERALARLAQAQARIDSGDVDGFVDLIDQTLRSYIEERFAVSARNRTTREFISDITEKPATAVPRELADNTQNLHTWLKHCDMVKFARGRLDRPAMEEMLTNLRTFIESTRMEAPK